MELSYYSNEKKGKAYIIHHREYMDTKNTERLGDDKDFSKLKSVLENFNFSVDLYFNKTAKQIRDIILTGN